MCQLSPCLCPRIIHLVKMMDPDLVIIDTSDGGGRRDLLPTAVRLYHEFNAEAMGVTSNGVLTKQLVYGLESQGDPRLRVHFR